MILVLMTDRNLDPDKGQKSLEIRKIIFRKYCAAKQKGNMTVLYL